MYVHSKTFVDLVKATDHANKMGHQLLTSLWCLMMMYIWYESLGKF